MPRKKKQLGRPARGLPPRIDATGEEIAQVFIRSPAGLQRRAERLGPMGTRGAPLARPRDGAGNTDL